MEDYEQKYKEALSRARVVNPGTKDYNIVTIIFPELKESEDNIFKELLHNLIVSNACTPSSKEIFSIYSKTKEDCLAWLEKQGEQKPTEEFKPKFKVGDWIVLDKGLYQIEKITDLFDGHFQYWITDGFWFFDGTEAHLWTIQDAKDGDVLAVASGIFIFDGTVEDGIYPFAYCGLTRHYGFEIYDRRLPFTHDNNVYPATKEQRDLLFQKMEEAGYKWNVVEKKLVKLP